MRESISCPLSRCSITPELQLTPEHTSCLVCFVFLRMAWCLRDWVLESQLKKLWVKINLSGFFSLIQWNTHWVVMSHFHTISEGGCCKAVNVVVKQWLWLVNNKLHASQSLFVNVASIFHVQNRPSFLKLNYDQFNNNLNSQLLFPKGLLDKSL